MSFYRRKRQKRFKTRMSPEQLRKAILHFEQTGELPDQLKRKEPL